MQLKSGSKNGKIHEISFISENFIIIIFKILLYKYNFSKFY